MKQFDFTEKTLEWDMKMQQRNNTAKNLIQMNEYPEYHVTVSHQAVNQTELNLDAQVV